MNAASFPLILLGVVLSAAAQLLLKAGTNAIGPFAFSHDDVLRVGWRIATEPHIVGGFTCYLVSAFVWIAALSRVEVSVAYPMLSLGYVLNAIAAAYLFGEAVTPTRLIGIGIIILGVYVVARS